MNEGFLASYKISSCHFRVKTHCSLQNQKQHKKLMCHGLIRKYISLFGIYALSSKIHSEVKFITQPILIQSKICLTVLFVLSIGSFIPDRLATVQFGSG